jgi:hypothetical protein
MPLGFNESFELVSVGGMSFLRYRSRYKRLKPFCGVRVFVDESAYYLTSYVVVNFDWSNYLPVLIAIRH